MPQPDDQIASRLAALLSAWEEACAAAHGGSAGEKPLLTAARLIEAGDGLAKALAAVGAVLALADKWTDDAANQIVIVYNDPAMNDAAAAVSHKSAAVRRTLAAEVRSAVLAALTGEEKPGG